MRFPKPTVAVVEGFAIGGGTQLALACDLRLCEPESRFGITPAKLGIVYGAGLDRPAGRRRRPSLGVAGS